jgi:alkylation response protein AidB-like acyl-CoA dehydrogenase
MDPVMSQDIEAVRDTVNRFMQTEVVPIRDGYEKRGEFPRDLIRKAGEAGLCMASARAIWLTRQPYETTMN